MLEDAYQMFPILGETKSSGLFWIYELMSLMLKTFICFIVRENPTVWLTWKSMFDILFVIARNHIV